MTFLLLSQFKKISIINASFSKVNKVFIYLVGAKHTSFYGSSALSDTAKLLRIINIKHALAKAIENLYLAIGEISFRKDNEIDKFLYWAI